MSGVCWAYVIVRYWRAIAEGWRRGWSGTRTYDVTCRVWCRESDEQPWRELDVDYLRSLAAA